MSTTPYAALQVSVNGGGAQTGGLEVPAGATIQLSAASTVGWSTPVARWEISTYPVGFALPAGWTADANGSYYYLSNSPPPSFTTDATLWGKYMLLLRVNGGIKNGLTSADMEDRSTALSVVSPSGQRDLGAFEDNQFSASRDWVGDQQKNLRAVESGFVAVPRSAKIMLVGDSQTVGNGFAGDGATAYREAFWVALRNQRARFSLMGNTAGVFRTGVDSMLGDGVYAATAGQTVAAADAQATATEAIYGPADIYVVLAGTNDTSAGSTAPQIIAALVALVKNRLVANLSAHVFVMTLCPWVSPASSYAAHDVVRLAVNAGLPAAMTALSSRVHVVEAGGLLTAAHMDASGNHPSGLGFRLIGQAAADAVAAHMGQFGSTSPRALMRRTAVPCLAITSNTGQSASIAATAGLTPTGHASFSCGFLWRPTNNTHAFQTRLMTAMGASFVANDWWGFDWVQTTNVLECWVGGFQGGTQVLQASGIVKINTWHAIMMAADASNNLLQMWCMRAGSDGKPQSMLAGAKLMPAWNLTSYNTFFGADAVLNGCEGLYSRFWVANGYVATADDAENWYYNQALPPGVSAYYSLEEGSGTAIAPALGETTLPNGSLASAGWSAAGAVPTPWDL